MAHVVHKEDFIPSLRNTSLPQRPFPLASQFLDSAINLTYEALRDAKIKVRVHNHDQFSRVHKILRANSRDVRPNPAALAEFREAEIAQGLARFKGTPLCNELKSSKEVKDILSLFNALDSRMPFAVYTGVAVEDIDWAGPLYVVVQAILLQGMNRGLLERSGSKLRTREYDVKALEEIIAPRFKVTVPPDAKVNLVGFIQKVLLRGEEIGRSVPPVTA